MPWHVLHSIEDATLNKVPARTARSMFPWTQVSSWPQDPKARSAARLAIRLASALTASAVKTQEGSFFLGVLVRVF